jgi:hypothetical protein
VGFSPDWLALREPVDHASRDPGLLARAAACAPAGATVLDLGSGTGSTARAFAGATDADWQWRFVDGERQLLEIAQRQHPGSEQVAMDLRDIDKLPLEGVALVTASALLDLMPLAWVSALAQRLQDAGIPFYAALNYNGMMHWSPPHTADTDVTEAFNTHQRSDKGIGAALGPTASDATARVFDQHGFNVHLGDSPWNLGPAQAVLHRELLVGIGIAAAEAGYTPAEGWSAHRRADVAQTNGYIGHTDVLALPRKAKD